MTSGPTNDEAWEQYLNFQFPIDWLWDETSGGWIDPKLAAEAMREELDYVRRHRIYHKATVA